MTVNFEQWSKKTNCISIGESSIENNGISIGPYARAKHKNSIVIGTNKTSHSENSVTLNDITFTEGQLLIGDKFNLIGNDCSANSPICATCNYNMISGIKWNRDENQNSSIALCFNCIFDVVIEQKARQQWLDKVGDPIVKLTEEINRLKEEMLQLKMLMNK